MKKIIFSLLTLVLFGCSGTTNESDTTKDTLVGKTDSNLTLSQPTDSTKENVDEGLIEKWTWNDKIVKPSKSSISNSKFSTDLLLKTWTWSDDNENQPALTFKKDSVDIPGEKKYIYTVNYDSLRIFTSYDHPGDGFTRGIITKLTKDSLIIKWSTDGMNKYVPLRNK